MEENSIRLDKYLWAVRLYKTRSDAAEAIKSQRVMINDAYVKASREVHPGDEISIRRPMATLRYRVEKLVSNRQPAKNVSEYCVDITPEEEKAKLNVPRETIFIFRERGTGRPTKKERRQIDAVMNGFYEED
ncbi:MAG: RNA-binding S4 domain-containing protein [Alistipes sp.]|nr:RNA-binding S4 domain-containing protein [Candidatus Alistipes equi]